MITRDMLTLKKIDTAKEFIFFTLVALAHILLIRSHTDRYEVEETSAIPDQQTTTTIPKLRPGLDLKLWPHKSGVSTFTLHQHTLRQM